MNDTSEWFEVERLADGCVQITEGRPVLPCNMLVFRDGGEAVLVDTGLGIADTPSMVREVAETDVRVLLTHSHWDHIGAAHRFDDVAIHDRERGPNGRVAIDVLSDEFDERPRQFVEDFRESEATFPDGFDPDTYEIVAFEGADALAPGQEIPVGDRTLELVPIPGHSPGQLAVLDRTSGICHGADVLEPGGQIYAHFGNCDIDDYRETMDRLVALRDDGAFDTLTTGHGDPMRGDDLSVLDDVQVALERVAADDADFELVDTYWGTARQYSVGGIEVLTRHS